MLAKASASTMSKASFVIMAPPPDTYTARGRRRLRSSRTTATEILAVVSAIAMIHSHSSLLCGSCGRAWLCAACIVHRSIASVPRSAFEQRVSGCRISPANSVRCSSQRSLTGDLNRGIDGVFEILRVVGRGLVSVAAAHAIVAGAHLAQGEPEMSRDRFGFLERHGASLPWRCPLIGGCER